MTETSETAPANGPSVTPTQAGDAEKSAASGPPIYPPDNSGNRVVWVAGVLVLILVVALLIAFLGAFRHWFALHTGHHPRRTRRVLQLLVRLRIRPR